MGQSQLLIIALALIVIGVAVAVGITQFSESALVANRDTLADDCHTLIAKAQGWYRKPTQLGGGGRTFTGLRFGNLGMGSGATTYSNEQGTYQLKTTAQQLTCIGTGNEITARGEKVKVMMVYYADGDSLLYVDNMEGKGVRRRMKAMN